MISKKNNFKVLLEDVKRKGFFHLLLANFLINFIGFGSQLFVAKFLSAIDLGRIKTMQSFISLAVILAGFGFNTAVLKLCSENKSISYKKEIFKVNFKLSIVSIVFVLIIMCGVGLGGFFSPDQDINRWMLLFMFSIPASVFTSLLICYLQALKKIQLMAYAQVGARILSILSLIVSTYFWKLPGFLLSSVLVGPITLIPLFRLAAIDWKYPAINSRDIFKQSFDCGKWSVASNGMNALSITLDIVLLNFLVKDRVMLGDYGFATIFILAMNQITGTVQAIAAPFFSEKSGNEMEFLRVLRKYQRLLVAVTAIVALLAIVFVPAFIRFAYWDKFKMTGIIFKILVARYFFWSCSSLFGVALIGLGKVKDNFIASSIYVPFAIALSVVFINRWGSIGAAYAQSTAGFFTMIIVYLNFKRAFSNHFKNVGKSHLLGGI